MRISRAIPVALLTVAVAVVAVAVVPGGHGHELRATFPSAVNVVRGAEVRAGGVRVGKVDAIELHGRAAALTLTIDDADVWPLRQGTRASIRLGGTVSYANRYIELQPGSGRPLDDGATLPAVDTTSPFELDQTLNIFDRDTRAGLGKLIDNGAATLARRGPRLAGAFGAAGPAFDETADTLARLNADHTALRTLVSAGAATAGTIARRDGELRDLVVVAADTLETIAAEGANTRRTLVRLPRALRAGRAAVTELDHSLNGVDALVTDIRPGARELRRVAAPLRRATAALRDVSPRLGDTLALVRGRGPGIARFLTDAIPFVRRLRPVLARVTPMAACARAYAPEIAGFFSTWSAGATEYDANGRYAQVNFQALPFSNFTQTPSSQVVRQWPQLMYAFVRPPGFDVGQSWMLGGCGVTPGVLHAANDPEARG